MAIAAVNLAAPKTRGKSAVEPGSPQWASPVAVGRNENIEQCRGVNADLQGWVFLWGAISARSWNGFVRFQHFLMEGLQRCVNERPPFWGRESDPQNGVAASWVHDLRFGVRFCPPKSEQTHGRPKCEMCHPRKRQTLQVHRRHPDTSNVSIAFNGDCELFPPGQRTFRTSKRG